MNTVTATTRQAQAATPYSPSARPRSARLRSTSLLADLHVRDVVTAAARLLRMQEGRVELRLA